MKPTKFARTRAGRKWHRTTGTRIDGKILALCGRVFLVEDAKLDHVENAIRCAFCEAKALEDER